MERASHVRIAPSGSEKKKGPGVRVPGPSEAKQRIADRPISTDLSAAFLRVVQARATVAALVAAKARLEKLSRAGAAFSAARKDHAALSALYREGFAVYEAAHEAGPDFETLLGVKFEALETALEAVGWFIVDPGERGRIAAGALHMLTAEGVRSHG